MQDRILLFIPAYNCEKQIVRVLESLKGEPSGYFERIIVVNNRSTDATEEVVRSFKESNPELNIHILRNHENYGLGGSHKVAFKYALDFGFDYVVVLHGDDQGNIRDFIPMLKRRIYRKYDCVLGARFMRGSRLKGYSGIRTIGNIVYDFLFAAVTGRRVFDLGSGLNMYSTKMLENNFYHKFPDNLTFNYCMVMALEYYNQHERYYPVSWSESDQVSNVKLGSQAIKVLKMLWEYFSDNEAICREYRDKPIDDYGADEV